MVTKIARSNFIIIFLGKCFNSDSWWNFDTNLWWQNNFVMFNRFNGNFLGHNTNSSLLWLNWKKKTFCYFANLCKNYRIFLINFFRWCDWFDTNPNGNWIFSRSFNSQRCFNCGCLDSGWRTRQLLCNRLYGHACKPIKKKNYCGIRKKNHVLDIFICRLAAFCLHTLLE